MLAVCAVVICAAFGMSDSASAQDVLDQGTNIANIGAGLNLRRIGGEDFSSATVNVFAERCFADNLWDDKSAFTAGGQLLGSFFKNGMSYFIGPRAGLHYQFVPKLDTYLFLALGLHGYNVGVDEVKSSGVEFGYNGGLGVRYMFTPTVGGYAELGYGVTILNIGASFKF